MIKVCSHYNFYSIACLKSQIQYSYQYANSIGDKLEKEFANLSSPYGITTDTSGNVYVADTDNNRIQKFTSYGIFITDWEERGSTVGKLKSPYGITTDTSDNVYVADIVLLIWSEYLYKSK